MTTIHEVQLNENADMRERFIASVRENRGWFVSLGILLFLTGVAAIAFPLASSIAVEIIIGIALLIAGSGQIIHSFGNRSWGGFFFSLLVGIIWMIGGAVFLTRPLDGLVALTFVIAIAFVAEGIVRSIFSFQMRPFPGWGWVLFGGLIAIAVGVMLLAQFPTSAAWAVGALVGINLLGSGIATLMLASAADNQEKPERIQTAG